MLTCVDYIDYRVLRFVLLYSTGCRTYCVVLELNDEVLQLLPA